LNDLLVFLGIQTWKPVLTALILPPAPLLLLLLVGTRLILPRRGLGWFVVILSTLLLWLSACSGTAVLLSKWVLKPPAALSEERIKTLKTGAKTNVAIVVLGGGMEPYAPEYGVSNLQHLSLERLRYGVWLGRETGVPVAFSGGVGWGQPEAKSEARIAAQIAASEFNRPLKWVEDLSRDTRENAERSVALLKPAGVQHIVLVTHAWHMPRSVHEFERAAGGNLRIEAAPMALAQGAEMPGLAWLPTAAGTSHVRYVLREMLGRLVNG
jgi:uncharacterized SAM-binding protein YcdF (DUF218 family)